MSSSSSFPRQLSFPFTQDANFCPSCKSFNRINPKCLHSHKATKPVVFSRCYNCSPGYSRTVCNRCYGKGYTYEIIEWEEFKKQPKGKIDNHTGEVHPYSNIL